MTYLDTEGLDGVHDRRVVLLKRSSSSPVLPLETIDPSLQVTPLFSSGWRCISSVGETDALMRTDTVVLHLPDDEPQGRVPYGDILVPPVMEACNDHNRER